MIRRCVDSDFDTIFEIINDSAQSYKGVIPADRWGDPYMPRKHLRQEIDAGVVFWGFEDDGELIGIMGIQEVKDVTLIRHAYVRTVRRNRGVGGKLIFFLKTLTKRPILVGTWAAAEWAIRFYENHEFKLVSWEEKECLLRKYWSIPARQTETSVVLANGKWFDEQQGRSR
jgi:N-acetylglutamate synthase-like GNAT family acetyltransferase